MIKIKKTLDGATDLRMIPFIQNSKSVSIDKHLADHDLEMLLKHVRTNKIQNLEIVIDNKQSQYDALYGYLQSEDAKSLKTLDVTVAYKIDETSDLARASNMLVKELFIFFEKTSIARMLSLMLVLLMLPMSNSVKIFIGAGLASVGVINNLVVDMVANFAYKIFESFDAKKFEKENKEIVQKIEKCMEPIERQIQKLNLNEQQVPAESADSISHMQRLNTKSEKSIYRS